MSISAECPHCGARYPKVARRLAGSAVPCRKCGQPFRIPSEKPAANPAPARMATRTADGPAPTAAVGGPAAKSGGVKRVPAGWEPGRVILNLYEVIGVLGQGGMGVVYKVRHKDWGVDLAVKVPRPEMLIGAGGVENFEREAETWVNLGLHPHTVTCYYLRRVFGVPSVFAEYVDGGSLHDLITGAGRLYSGGRDEALARMLDLGVQMAWGLGHAHDRGLIHLDVKPANMLVTRDGLAKATDFGLARAWTGGALEGKIAGTPQYYSPEQAARRNVAQGADLWSFGLCLLEMFQGGRTWEWGAVAAEALEEYLKAGPVREGLPAMPEGLVELLRRCFRDDPADRPAGMAEAARTLIEVYRKGVGKAFPRTMPRAGRDTADGLNNQAVSLMDLGLLDEAEQTWARALEVQPHHLQSTYNRGLVAWRWARRTDEAFIRELTEAARSQRNDEAGSYLRALVHLERDDAKSALKLLKAAPEETAGDEMRESAAIARARIPKSNRSIGVGEEHLGNVNALAFDPVGRFVTSGGEDGLLVLWAVDTNRSIKVIETRLPINAVCFTPGGGTVLAGGGGPEARDFTIRKYDTGGGDVLKVFKGHHGPVRGLDVNRVGSLAVSGSEDGTVKIWDLEAGRCLRTLGGRGQQIRAVRFGPKGDKIYSGGSDRSIVVWDVASGERLQALDGHTGGTNGLSVSANGKVLLSAGADCTLMIHAEGSGAPRILRGHHDEVAAAAITASGRNAVSAGLDRTVRLWDVLTGRCLRTFEGHGAWVLALALSPDGRLCATGGVDRTVRLWQVDGEANSFRAPLVLSRVASSESAFSAVDRYESLLRAARMAVSLDDPAGTAQAVRDARAQPGHHRAAEAFQMWRRLYLQLPRGPFGGGWEERALTGKGPIIAAADVSADGGFVLAVGSDGRLSVWTPDDGALVRSIGIAARGTPTAAVFGPDASLAAVGDDSGSIRLWNLGLESIENEWPTGHGRITSIAMGPDRSSLFTAGTDGRVRVWDLTTGALVGEMAGHTAAINSLSFSLDGRLLLTAAGDRTGEDAGLGLWDPSSGRRLLTMLGHEPAATSAGLTPDGKTAISVGADGALKVWDLGQGVCRETIAAHNGAVSSLRLSLDGRHAVTGGYDKTVKLWDLYTLTCLRTFEGHAAPVTGVLLAPDGRFAASAGREGALKLYALDWELLEPPEGPWDEGARMWLRAYLHLRETRSNRAGGSHSERVRLTRSRDEFELLAYRLGCAGYGWISKDKVREELNRMAEADRAVTDPGGKPGTKRPRGPSRLARLFGRGKK